MGFACVGKREDPSPPQGEAGKNNNKNKINKEYGAIQERCCHRGYMVSLLRPGVMAGGRALFYEEKLGRTRRQTERTKSMVPSRKDAAKARTRFPSCSLVLFLVGSTLRGVVVVIVVALAVAVQPQ